MTETYDAADIASLDADLQQTAWENHERRRDKENRIEALRAASRIVAGIHAGGQAKHLSRADRTGFDIEDPVIAIAEQFARWLEDGKR